MKSQMIFPISELEERLVAGDREAIVPLYNAYSDLTIIESSWARKAMPWKKDDILSAARAALAEALTRIASIKFEGEVGAYLRSRVRCAVTKFVRADHTVRIPWKSYKNGVRVELCEVPDDLGVEEYQPITKEDILPACHDDRDREIIELLEKGKTRQEICSIVGIGQSALCERVANLRTKIKALL